MPTSWKCDACGGVIANPAAGWVEWRKHSEPNPSGPQGYGLRLVHHFMASPKQDAGGCSYVKVFGPGEYEHPEGDAAMDHHMDYFMGHAGLIRLLNLIDDNRVPVAEATEMVRRLHVPGYGQGQLPAETHHALTHVLPESMARAFLERQGPETASSSHTDSNDYGIPDALFHAVDTVLFLDEDNQTVKVVKPSEGF